MGSQKDTRILNPFPGLRPFSPDESNLFFGRENESREVVSKLLKNRFVTVIGASGTGKSSLIYCGVLPGVQKESGGEGNWKIITFRPGNDPFGNIGAAIAEQLNPSSGDVSVETILLDLHLNIDGIAYTLKKYLGTSNSRILLVIDQFEELFRYSTQSTGAENQSQAPGFVSKLVSAVSSDESEIYTIITMRSDFIGECAHYQGLTQLINNSNYLVPHMGENNYRQAIEGPVKFAGAKIDPNLVETLLSHIGSRTDQLPVLQHAMMRTWDYWKELDEPDRPLSVSDYESVGTMSDAMSRHANEAYEELDQRGKEICEKMFRTITEKGTDNKGIRHPSGVKRLTAIISCTSEELFTVIEKFRIPARSFITPRHDIPLSNDSIIDLSHESLMRLWDRLREWVDDEAASVQMYLRLSEASAMFQEGKTTLWRPPDLQLAINWRDKNKPTLEWAVRYDPAFERAMMYLATSEKQYLDEEEGKIRLQRRQMRRARIIAMILGTAAIISLGFMLFAFVQKIEADRATDEAEVRRKEAEFEKGRADEQTEVALEQKAIADTNAYQARISAEEARREKENAERQRLLAERSADLAKRNELIATQQKDSATMAKEQAEQSEALKGKGRKLFDSECFQLVSRCQSNHCRSRDSRISKPCLHTRLISSIRIMADWKTTRIFTTDSIMLPGNMGTLTISSLKDTVKVLKWTTEGDSQTFQVIYSGTDIIEILSVSPDASWLACGSSSSSIRMVPLKGNSMQYELMGHKGKVKSLVFSFDGKYLYSAALDGKVLKWDLAARTSTDVTTGNRLITSIDVSSRGNKIAGISSDGSVLVWNPDNAQESFTLPTSARNIRVVRFKPDNGTLAIGDATGLVELWDVDERKKISEVRAHTAPVNDIRFNSKYKQMATASNDKTIKIFNNLDDLTEPPISFTDHDGFVLVLQFSTDGELIISGTYEGTTNLLARPTHVSLLVTDICTLVTRNMTQDEWNTYVARDIPLQPTCQDQSYNIKVNVKR